jgi:hypothetical protein
MIHSRRSAANYGTDAVAQSVRNFIAPGAPRQNRSAAAPSAPAPLDLACLYPNIFRKV